MIKIINTGAKSVLPFSPAIKAGDFVYVSGQASVDRENGSVIEGTFEDQVVVVLNNLKNIAMEANCTLDDCVKFTVYLKDLENFSIVNSIMERHLTEPYPARAAVEVSRLPKDVHIEIDAILFKD